MTSDLVVPTFTKNVKVGQPPSVSRPNILPVRYQSVVI
jgi:hypothetical protein